MALSRRYPVSWASAQQGAALVPLVHVAFVQGDQSTRLWNLLSVVGHCLCSQIAGPAPRHLLGRACYVQALLHCIQSCVDPPCCPLQTESPWPCAAACQLGGLLHCIPSMSTCSCWPALLSPREHVPACPVASLGEVEKLTSPRLLTLAPMLIQQP